MQEIFYSFVGILLVFFSSLIYFLLRYRAKNEKVARLLEYLMIALGAYAGILALLPFLTTKNQVIIAVRIGYIPIIFIAPIFAHFVVQFLDVFEKFKKIIIAGYACSLFLLPFIFTRYFLNDLVFISAMDFLRVPGVMFHFFILEYWTYVIFPLYLLFKNYNKHSQIKNVQIKLIGLGGLIGFLLSGTIFLRWYGFEVPSINSFGAYIGVFLMFYAIVTTRFMNVKLAIRNSFVNIIALLFVFLLIYFSKGLINISSPNNYSLIYSAYFSVLIVVFLTVRKYLITFSNTYFFTTLYDSQKSIKQLSRSLQSTLDIAKIYNEILNFARDVLHVKGGAVIIENGGWYELKCKFGNLDFKDNLKEAHLSRDQFFLRPFLALELHDHDPKKYQNIKNFVVEKSIEAVAPLIFNNKILGFIILCRKESGDLFDSSDMQMLEIINGICASAIKNAQLYNDVKEKNAYLEELVEIKNDFLRVVNHQLNTPISIIRMGLGAYYDKMVPAEKAIEYIDAGLKRLSGTLSDFWDAYNLVGRKKTIYPKKVSLSEIIDEIIIEKNKKISLSGKKLEIVVERPNFRMKPVYCDEDQVSKAISLILENAVNYSRQGEINLSFAEKEFGGKNYIMVFIKDQGIGIDETNKKMIFNKFFRASNAMLVKPDGSGLSLFIADKIIKNNDGFLNLENSELGKGTTFSIALPCKK